MDQDTLQNYIDQIVSEVVLITDKYQSKFVSDIGLEAALSSLSNKVGNVKHYINERSTAMNGNDKFMLSKSAINETNAAKDALILLFHAEFIDENEYQNLLAKIANLDYLLRSEVDPDYA